MFNRFSDYARIAIANSQREAERLHHDHIGTEHLLLGVMKVGSSDVVTVLGKLSTNAKAVRHEIEELIKVGNGPLPSGALPFSPQAKRALEQATVEAVAFHHDFIGTEHIFLGLFTDQDGAVAEAFRHLHLTAVDVRAKILEVLIESGGEKAKSRSIIRRVFLWILAALSFKKGEAVPKSTALPKPTTQSDRPHK